MINRLFAALLCFICAAFANAAEVEISSGKIEGSYSDGVSRYLGLPYATAPVGDLRWRAPHDVEHWDGTRQAFTFGSACMQIGTFYTSNDEASFDQPYGSEDCLFLNVWVPEATSSPRPVLIFFHGGSGIAGSASHPLYDATRLARETGAVVITANYRLGVWGALQSPALQTDSPAESSGNFFLLDMIKVLDWAHENCAAFGCDSDNITISGQSAGAVAVLALLRSPLAEGKFHRAISFSGLPLSASLKTAQKNSQKLYSALLSLDGSAKSSKDAKKILADMTTQDLRNYLYRQTPEDLLKASGRGLSPAFYADGTVLLELEKADQTTAAVVSRVPLLMGKTRDEMKTLLPISKELSKAVAMWPLINGEPRTSTLSEKLGVFRSILRSVNVKFAEWHTRRQMLGLAHDYADQLPAVYVYQFEWDNYPEPWKSDFGAFHGSDVPLIFGNFNDKKSYMRFAWTSQNHDEREAIHGEIMARISAFLHSGDPNGQRLETQWLPWDKQEYIQFWGKD